MPPKAETGSHSSALSQAAGQVARHRHAAGVGVLDDDDRRAVEFRHAFEGGVGVVQVVVGQLLALHLPRRRDARAVRAIHVEGGAAGAGSRHSAAPWRSTPAQRQARREVLPFLPREPARDRGIIGRRARIGRGRQAPARRQAGAALRGDLGLHLGEMRGLGQHRDMRMVLRRASGSSPGRRCRCSRCSRRRTRPARPSPRTDRGSPPPGRSARCRAASICARCSARSRRPRMPPCTCGTSVLTRPSRISGKPVCSDTSFTGDAGLAQRAGRAAGGQDLDARRGEEPAEFDQPRLVGDGQQGAADGEDIAHGGAHRPGRRARPWHGAPDQESSASLTDRKGFGPHPRRPCASSPSPSPPSSSPRPPPRTLSARRCT